MAKSVRDCARDFSHKYFGTTDLLTLQSDHRGLNNLEQQPMASISQTPKKVHQEAAK